MGKKNPRSRRSITEDELLLLKAFGSGESAIFKDLLERSMMLKSLPAAMASIRDLWRKGLITCPVKVVPDVHYDTIITLTDKGKKLLQ